MTGSLCSTCDNNLLGKCLYGDSRYPYVWSQCKEYHENIDLLTLKEGVKMRQKPTGKQEKPKVTPPKPEKFHVMSSDKKREIYLAYLPNPVEKT